MSIPILSIIAAGIFGLIGILHLGFALYDFSAKPRYFRPNDDDVLASLKHTYSESAGNTRDYWTNVLGIHLCHAVGVLLFAVLIVIAAAYNIVALRPLLALVGIAYALIAWRFWARKPVSASLIGTIALLGSWI